MGQYEFTFHNGTQEQISVKLQLSPNSWGATIRIPAGESHSVTDDKPFRTQKKYWLLDSAGKLIGDYVSANDFSDSKQVNVTRQGAEFTTTMVPRNKEGNLAGFTTALRNPFKRNNSEPTSLPTTSEGRSPV